jgi:uncharacterized protein YkwD
VYNNKTLKNFFFTHKLILMKLINFFQLCIAGLFCTLAEGLIDTTQLLTEINNARTDPSGYANTIEQKYMNFRRFKWLMDNNTYQTSEGINAVRDTITWLRSAPAVGALTLETGITVMAQVHANSFTGNATSETTPYVGCRSENVGQRLDMVGGWTSVGENIVGRVPVAEHVVPMMLVSDGDNNRQMRLNMMSSNFTQVGFGQQNTTDVNDMLVVNFAAGFSC